MLPVQHARLGRGMGAARRFLESRQPHQRSQPEPVPGGPIGRQRPRLDGPEGQRAPKRASGSTAPIAVRASSSISPASASDSTVLKLPSTAATSTRSVRGKLTGTFDLRKNFGGAQRRSVRVVGLRADNPCPAAGMASLRLAQLRAAKAQPWLGVRSHRSRSRSNYVTSPVAARGVRGPPPPPPPPAPFSPLRVPSGRGAGAQFASAACRTTQTRSARSDRIRSRVRVAERDRQCGAGAAGRGRRTRSGRPVCRQCVRKRWRGTSQRRRRRRARSQSPVRLPVPRVHRLMAKGSPIVIRVTGMERHGGAGALVRPSPADRTGDRPAVAAERSP